MDVQFFIIHSMFLSIRFDPEKNLILKATRGVCFDDVIDFIREGDILADKRHHNQSRAAQRIYIININDYAYVVPYTYNPDKNEIFLKTVYPSRKYTSKYLRKGENHDN